VLLDRFRAFASALPPPPLVGCLTRKGSSSESRFFDIFSCKHLLPTDQALAFRLPLPPASCFAPLLSEAADCSLIVYDRVRATPEIRPPPASFSSASRLKAFPCPHHARLPLFRLLPRYPPFRLEYEFFMCFPIIQPIFRMIFSPLSRQGDGLECIYSTCFLFSSPFLLFVRLIFLPHVAFSLLFPVRQNNLIQSSSDSP